MSTEPTNTGTLSATPAPVRDSIALSGKGVQLSTLEDAFRFSRAVVASGWAPKGMDKPEAVMVAIQYGLEIGLSPMAALQNVAVINGRPGIYGDAALALVRGSGLLESYSQKIEGEGDKRAAVVMAKRKGEAGETVSSFSVADAKQASLWGKQGPWSQYPDRMLTFRARGFLLRDLFGDVLKGLTTVEELRDMPSEGVKKEPKAGAFDLADDAVQEGGAK